MAKYNLGSPVVGAAIGGGLTALGQYGFDAASGLSAGDSLAGASSTSVFLYTWANSLGLALGLAAAGALFAMKHKDVAAVAAVAALAAGAKGTIDELTVNFGANAAPTGPASAATNGIDVIQARGFGAARRPAVSLFGAQTSVVGPSKQLQSRTYQQNPAAFGGGHF